MIGVLLVVPAAWFGLAPVAVVWLVVLTGAHAKPRVELTGKKDKAGYPTPASPVEARRDAKYRYWAVVKWRLASPSVDLLPGWPARASFLAAVWAGCLAGCLPVAYGWLQWLNAAAAYVLVSVFTAARRRTAIRGEMSPGVRVNSLLRARSQLPGVCARLIGGALLGGMTAFGIGWLLASPALDRLRNITFLPGTDWIPWRATEPAVPTEVWTALIVIGGAGLGISGWWVNTALAKWRQVCQARAEWAPRWEMLKQDPAPRLVDSDNIGAAVVDTFDAPGNVGAVGYWPLAAKITQTIGQACKIAVLSMPNLDQNGQPQPGTRHPLRFRVVRWPSDQIPCLSDPTLGPEVAALIIECGMVWACDAGGYGRPILNQTVPLARTSPAPDDMAPATAGGTVDRHSSDGPDPSPGEASAANDDLMRAPSTQAPSTQAWASTWFLPDGPDMTNIRALLIGDIAGVLGVDVLADHRAGETGVIYLGALLGGTTDFDDDAAPARLKYPLAQTMANLASEDQWNRDWGEALKLGSNPPRPEFPTLQEAVLGNGSTVRRMGFMIRKGLDPLDFFGMESKMATALDGATFVAITGWPDPNDSRQGARHSQAFALIWSHQPVPSSPDNLAPAPAGSTACGWVLSGMVNSAFRSARLAQPEVTGTRCLTAPHSPEHIWEIGLRLYGGVTLTDIRSAAHKLRQSLGSEWLRVMPSDDGCSIVAGAAPDSVRLRSPRRDTNYLISLDWEQAWLDSKISGNGGILPTLTRSDVLPLNHDVQVLDFTLPPGLDYQRVRQARGKLQTATGNGYIDVQPGAAGPDTIRLLVARNDPMPTLVPYDFDTRPDLGVLRFATGVDGGPVTLDLGANPHLLLAGTTGSGKSVAAQALLTCALSSGCRVIIVDVQKGGADFRFAEDRCLRFAVDLADAAATLRAVRAESQRRQKLNSGAGAGHVRELDHPPPPWFVFLDEFTGLIAAGTKPPSQPENDPELESARLQLVADYTARKEIGFLVARITAEARSSDIHLLLATQNLSAKMLEGPLAGLKTNLARILLGKATYGDQVSALKLPDYAPDLGEVVPKGRGIWEPLTEASMAIQLWHATPTEYRQFLVDNIPAADHLDTTPFHKKPQTPGGFAVIGGRQDSLVPDRGPDAETVELGDLELSLDELENGDENPDDKDADDVGAEPLRSDDHGDAATGARTGDHAGHSGPPAARPRPVDADPAAEADDFGPVPGLANWKPAPKFRRPRRTVSSAAVSVMSDPFSSNRRQREPAPAREPEPAGAPDDDWGAPGTAQHPLPRSDSDPFG